MSDKAVFTTKYVIENKSEIVYVSHDKDGDWQFFSKEDASERDARVISLNEIVELDPSIKEILWIPEGTEAWRKATGNEWTTKVNPK